MTRWRPAASPLRDRLTASTDRLRVAFVAAAATWAALLVAVPWLASRAHASSPASLLIVGVYAIGSLVCHQLPERSFYLWSAQLPVCARCTGIYVGAVVGAVVSALARVRSGTVRRQRTLRPDARIALAAAVIPSLLTLIDEWTTGDMPSNAIRFAAGLPIGVVVAWLVVTAADNQVN
jgi:uncharacterized membrane protein